jgi:hypothetical protein
MSRFCALSADAGDAEASRVRTRTSLSPGNAVRSCCAPPTLSPALPTIARAIRRVSILAYARPRRPGFRSPRKSKPDATLISDSGHARRVADVPSGSAQSSTVEGRAVGRRCEVKTDWLHSIASSAAATPLLLACTVVKTTTRSPSARTLCSLLDGCSHEGENPGDGRRQARLAVSSLSSSILAARNLGPFNNQSYYVGRPKARRESQLQPCSGPQSRRFDGFPGRTAT